MSGSDSVYSTSVAGQVIDRAISRGRLAHGILLSGADAASLESFARHLAARLLKLPATWADSTADHANVTTLRPSGKSRQIRVGDDAEEANTMRFFTRQLAQSPLAGDRKVGIVFDAECLNANSSNAFLKTLEEPPLDTTILLLTTRPYSLLTTIRSRCQNFKVPASDVIAADPEAASWIADYTQWLRDLASGIAAADKHVAARQVITVYALVARFTAWIEAAGAKAVSELKAEGSLENLDRDEADAVKSTASIGVRQRFLTEIEKVTCLTARERSGANAAAAVATITALERVVGLLRANFNAGAALEVFLLTALRAWSRRD
jgi:DNA polymerase III subunit delta'